MALLHRLRDGGRELSSAGDSRLPNRTACLALWAALALAGCKAPPELRPDEVLKAELGLTDRDRVHRVVLTGGDLEVVVPRETTLREGSWVEFVTADWRVHEVAFEADSLSPEQRTFMQRTDQLASPPLVRRESRFVLGFADAPPGRYPFLVEGNTSPGRGAIVVTEGG